MFVNLFQLKQSLPDMEQSNFVGIKLMSQHYVSSSIDYKVLQEYYEFYTGEVLSRKIPRLTKCNVVVSSDKYRFIDLPRTFEEIQFCLKGDGFVEVKVFKDPNFRYKNIEAPQCQVFFKLQFYQWKCFNFSSDELEFHYTFLYQIIPTNRSVVEKPKQTNFSAFLEGMQVSWHKANQLCQNVYSVLPTFSRRSHLFELESLIRSQHNIRKIQAFFISLYRTNKVRCKSAVACDSPVSKIPVFDHSLFCRVCGSGVRMKQLLSYHFTTIISTLHE